MGDACVRELTSKVANIVYLVICNDSMNSTKSLVSLMYEGSCFTAGWWYVSRNLEMFSVAELQLLAMGLSDMGFCVFSLGSICWC